MSDPTFSWRAVVARLLSDDGRAARRSAAIVTGVVVVLVAGVAGLAAAQRSSPPVDLALPRATASAEPADAGGDAAPAAPTTTVVAHAAGAVVHPGVYRLPSGARVSDLLAAAGGARADADLDAVNLAAKVEDGQRVYVPRQGESVEPSATGADAVGAAAGSAVVDLNTATLEQLDALPGVGPSTAQAILDYRKQHGRFRSVDELLEVRGIGEAKLRQIRPRVRV